MKKKALMIMNKIMLEVAQHMVSQGTAAPVIRR
jgi:uncharacterized phosphosugar-binding protein